MKLVKHKCLLILFVSLLVSCYSNDKNERIDSTESKQVKSNVTEIISTDIEKLSRILDFTTYQPIKVEFKYVFIDNSGQNERFSVPGPSDYCLEAVLYFDEKTYYDMDVFETNLEWMIQNHKKEEFNFEWLPQNVKKELDEHNRKDYKGHPDFFFGTGVNGKAWYLDHKILLREETN